MAHQAMTVIRDKKTLGELTRQWKSDRLRVALVPTMGALHDGHLSLVRHALSIADKVVVSIFVNPRQFNNDQDLSAYPRVEDEDCALLQTQGAHVLYAPDVTEMYPQDFATTIHVSGVSEGLCGDYRPGHFDGVATVVLKLLLQSNADIAIFGEKDFQQVHVVRRLVKDLDVATEILTCPTLRESDGLAMSSRNRLLNDKQRVIAGQLALKMQVTVDAVAAGRPIDSELLLLEKELLSAGFDRVEYAQLRSETDLSSIDGRGQSARLLVAAWVGDVRLIDNMPIPQEL